jgi:ankyrin repeat protein
MHELLGKHGALRAPWDLSLEEIKTEIRNGRTFEEEAFFESDVLEKADIELVGMLLDRNPDFVKDLDGRSFRTTSVKFVARRPTLELLLEHGYDINKGDWRGATLLHYCAQFGDLEMIDFCVDHGADLNIVELEYGGTPLATAARHGKLDAAVLLLKLGADPSVPVNQTWATPLAQAKRSGNKDIAALL